MFLYAINAGSVEIQIEIYKVGVQPICRLGSNVSRVLARWDARVSYLAKTPTFRVNALRERET